MYVVLCHFFDCDYKGGSSFVRTIGHVDSEQEALRWCIRANIVEVDAYGLAAFASNEALKHLGVNHVIATTLDSWIEKGASTSDREKARIDAISNHRDEFLDVLEAEAKNVVTSGTPEQLRRMYNYLATGHRTDMDHDSFGWRLCICEKLSPLPAFENYDHKGRNIEANFHSVHSDYSELGLPIPSFLESSQKNGNDE